MATRTAKNAPRTGRDVTSELEFLTRALKAPTLRESITRLAERAREESWTHEEFLAACLQREVAARESHGGEGRIRAARFPARKSLEDFDYDHARGLKRETIAQVGIQRAHVELYIRHLGDTGLRVSSINTMMHGVRGFFRFAHIDGLIPADPAVYARLPKVHQDETRTHGLDRLELIRFLQVAQTITVHHGALAYLLGINALRASEAAAVRIEDYRETLRGHRVLHLVGKGNKPATMPLTVPVLRVLEACRGERTDGPLVLRPISGKPIDRRGCYRMVARIAKVAGIPRHISPHSLRHAAITNALDAGVPLRDAQILARHADPRTTEHYDRARGNLDRHGVHFLSAYVAGV